MPDDHTNFVINFHSLHKSIVSMVTHEQTSQTENAVITI